MNLETYTPDVNKFIKYYTDQASGKNKTKKTMQIGGTSMGARRNNKKYFVISPSEQVVRQAEALVDNGIKEPVKRKRVIKQPRHQTKRIKTQLG